MRHLRILGVGVVVALVAFSAASASAAPEWGACVKALPKNTGSYSDKLCTVASEPGMGKYELVGGSVGKGKPFKLKSTQQQVLHVVLPHVIDLQIACEKLKGSGVPVAPNGEKELVLELKKCAAFNGAYPCENVAKETIRTNAISGTLAEVEGHVGEIFKPETGTYLAEFECGGGIGKVRVLGQAFGEYAGNVNTVSKTSVLDFTVANYIGELEPGYQPLTNRPTAGPPSYGVLGVEIFNKTGEWEPPGGFLSGLEGETEVKGEALMIKT